MLRFSLLILVFLGLSVPVSGADLSPGPEQMFPDLLEDETAGDGLAPDLLRGEPYINDPQRILGDPLFEDDYSLAPPTLVVHDPLESMNRAFFQFNDRLYYWVLKPVKTVYAEILPADIRQCLGNFFTNLTAPIHLTNNLLQGEVEDAGIVLGRFLINSTLGIFGFVDPAADEFDIRQRHADFGQTLGKWGVGEGVYLYWPGLGPSTIRDSVGLFTDIYFHPVFYFSDNLVFDFAYVSAERVNELSVGPEVYEELKRISLDPYVAARQAYYEYRRRLISER